MAFEEYKACGTARSRHRLFTCHGAIRVALEHTACFPDQAAQLETEKPQFYQVSFFIYTLNVRRCNYRLECCFRNCNRSRLYVIALTCFHCHVQYCVHSNTITAYISATVSVRHFNRADSLCSHTLHQHDPDAGCLKHRKHNIHLDMNKTFEQINQTGSSISICSQMFHCHDRCRVFQKPTYLSASISVRHFK